MFDTGDGVIPVGEDLTRQKSVAPLLALLKTHGFSLANDSNLHGVESPIVLNSCLLFQFK
jgi:hypothetical protein